MRDTASRSSPYSEAGRRRRKEVNYSQDLMSDREWLKTIDEAFNESGDEEEPDMRKKNQERSAKIKDW